MYLASSSLNQCFLSTLLYTLDLFTTRHSHSIVSTLILHFLVLFHRITLFTEKISPATSSPPCPCQCHLHHRIVSIYQSFHLYSFVHTCHKSLMLFFLVVFKFASASSSLS